MSSQPTLSKHLDKTVIRLFIVVFLISASVFAYRYTKYKPCEEVDFRVLSKELRQGELIKFADYTENANSWEWKFGDDSEIATSKAPLHIYNKPGEYTVSLLVNNICEKFEVITINEKLFVIDSTKLPKFKLPNTIEFGETLKVKDETENASTWEWYFGETGNANSTKRRAEYKYKEPGLYTVSLVVNGDMKHISKKKINVLPPEEETSKIEGIVTNSKTPRVTKRKPLEEINKKPAVENTAKTKPKTVPFISDADFRNKIMLISEEKLNANAFSEYLCGEINKSIVVNGKTTTFLVFCESIKGKKLKIKDLTVYRDKGSNCIKTVTINHRKFGIF